MVLYWVCSSRLGIVEFMCHWPRHLSFGPQVAKVSTLNPNTSNSKRRYLDGTFA